MSLSINISICIENHLKYGSNYFSHNIQFHYLFHVDQCKKKKDTQNVGKNWLLSVLQCLTDLKEGDRHPHLQALVIPTGRASLRHLGHLACFQPCPADDLRLLHPLNGSPEECSTGVAAMSCK